MGTFSTSNAFSEFEGSKCILPLGVSTVCTVCMDFLSMQKVRPSGNKNNDD